MKGFNFNDIVHSMGFNNSENAIAVFREMMAEMDMKNSEDGNRDEEIDVFTFRKPCKIEE